LKLLLCTSLIKDEGGQPQQQPHQQQQNALLNVDEITSQWRDSCVTWSHAIVDVFSDSQRVLLLLVLVMLLLQGGQPQTREEVAKLATM